MIGYRLSFTLILVTAVVWAGCGVAPFGMYWHSPQRLEQMPLEDEQIEVPAPRPDTPVIVLKRFDNRARTPVGARYKVVGKGQYTVMKIEPDSMEELYTPYSDLAVPLYEAVSDELTAAGYQVWTDFDPNRHAIKGPPGLSRYVVLHAVLTHLEINSLNWQPELMEDIDTRPIHDAAIAHLEVQMLAHDGRKISAAPVDAALRLDRQSGDILHGLANRLAVQLADIINREAR